MTTRKLLIPAILISVIAVFLILSYIQNLKTEFGVETRQIEVVVAKKTLEPGTVLSEDDLDIQKVSPLFEKMQVILPAQKNSLVNREIVRKIEVNAPILFSDFEEEDRRRMQRDVLADRIIEGERAITINVSESSGLAHLLTPGDSVDVIATFDMSTQARERGNVTKTILQNVPILAVGNIFDPIQIRPGTTRYNTVTLLVPPQAAQLLVFVREAKRGDITLALRNRNDLEPQTLKTVEFSELLDDGTLEEIQKEQDRMQRTRRQRTPTPAGPTITRPGRTR
jgi:pilus assembly protein CpaB